MDKTYEKQAIVLGRVKDLGIGNPDGIPSILAEASLAELQDIASQDNEALVEPDDLLCTACIDGRRRLCNADGSPSRTRLHRVDGSASNLGVALNGGAPIVERLDPNATLGQDIETIDEFIGYRSAHLGGCGGANGEIRNNRDINQNPAILAAVKALMDIPVVRQYLGASYDDELAERVRVAAGGTADFLESKGWNAKTYIDGVVGDCPENVEDLEVDEDDVLYHGHHENKLTIIVGDKTSAQCDEFVWNLKASKAVAEKMAGSRGHEGYTQVLIAELAKHIAVTHELVGADTPVFLQVA